MTATVFWQNQAVPVRFSRRKTIALHVKDGAIEVRAPHQTAITFAQQFLNERSQWLQQALAEQEKRRQDRIDYRFAHRIPFMGIDVPLLRVQGKKGWQLKPQGLQCSLPDLEDGAALISLLNDFYQQQARFWLTKKTRQQVTELGLDQRLKDVRLRRTRTKWGHCTAAGRIQYNWLIMMAPETVIDYLVAHEVAHLQHLDHSPAFWQLVEQAHPRYREDRRWLHDNGHRLSVDGQEN